MSTYHGEGPATLREKVAEILASGKATLPMSVHDALGLLADRIEALEQERATPPEAEPT